MDDDGNISQDVEADTSPKEADDEPEDELDATEAAVVTNEPETSDALEPANGDVIEPESGDVIEPESGDVIEPESGDEAEPASGDAEPETGDAELETGDAEPDNGDAEPETGDAELETGDAEPDNGDAEPETGDAELETGDAEPDNGDAELETGDAEPETGDAELETGDAELETGDAELETGDAELETGDAEPDNGDAEPETVDAELETGDAEPDNGDAELETGDAELETGDAELETGYAELETGDAELETGDAEPETGDAEPETGDAELETGDAELETGDAELETGDAEPDNGDAELETGDAELETGDAEPETGDAEPETGDAELETGDAEPETGDAQPETGDAEIETGDAKPETGDAEPETDIGVQPIRSGEAAAPPMTGADSPAVTEAVADQEPSAAKLTDSRPAIVDTEAVPMASTQSAEMQAKNAALSQSVGGGLDGNAAATVKFMLMPCAQVTTRRCFLQETVLQMKEHFADELRIPASVILLLFDGKSLADQLTLSDLGVGPNSMVQLEMQSADPVNTPIKAFRPRQGYHMPDVITVRVLADDEVTLNDIVVEIERCTLKKPFLGGYRHKETGVEFHHASAQTNKKVKPPPTVEHFCRDTQTVEEKLRVQQTTNNMTTQMTKVGVYVATATDRLIAPGDYTTADTRQQHILDQVIVIQKYYRRWLARCYVQQVRGDAQARLDWEREQELRKKKEKEDRIRREFERRMNPKTKEDFDLLYHALEKWRQEEVERINAQLSGAERKAALCQLLEQESQLIASIGRHKLDADVENKRGAIKGFLDQTSAPKRWRSYDGRVMSMATPYTLRATELKEIYNSINMKYLTQDERLDVLLTLKHTVKEHNCKLTQELIALIDREADLLLRGVKETNLEGLRQRISTLFLQYLKTPSFNPEAARLLKVPQDPLQLCENIYFCSCCGQYLPSADFQLSTNSRSVGHCRRCRQTDNMARQRQDLSHYRYMLRTLRKSEEAYADDSKIAFLMQETDLRHLVENVWSSQSVLSAWEDLYDLVLVRWDKTQEWSPWNCILLTKEEATSHNNLVDLDEAYGKILVHKVEHKQTLAQNYFSRLPGMAEQLRSRVVASQKPRAPFVTGTAVKQPV